MRVPAKLSLTTLQNGRAQLDTDGYAAVSDSETVVGFRGEGYEMTFTATCGGLTVQRRGEHAYTADMRPGKVTKLYGDEIHTDIRTEKLLVKVKEGRIYIAAKYFIGDTRDLPTEIIVKAYLET